MGTTILNPSGSVKRLHRTGGLSSPDGASMDFAPPLLPEEER
jgi:hypothetical protein